MGDLEANLKCFLTRGGLVEGAPQWRPLAKLTIKAFPCNSIESDRFSYQR